MKRTVELWKYDKTTGALKYVRLRTYVLSTFLLFLWAFIISIIPWILEDTNIFTLNGFLEALAEAAGNTTILCIKFVCVLYALMTIAGLIMDAEGDPLQKRLYAVVRKRRIYNQVAKHIPEIPKRSKRNIKTVTRAGFPVVVIVCEKFEITSGSFKRIPMALNAHKMLQKGVAEFEPTHMVNLFNEDYIFSGRPAWKVISDFNDITLKIETLHMLRNCDSLAALELRVVCDETLLQDNDHNDDLLRLQIHKIPCAASQSGKIHILNFDMFNDADALTRDFDKSKAVDALIRNF